MAPADKLLRTGVCFRIKCAAVPTSPFTDRKYLFVIDGAKALRDAIEEVFGADQPVQRCRNHKMQNVMDELPKEQQAQAMNLMRAAWRVSDAEEGVKRLEQSARFLEHEYESTARSLREDLAEMFTVQRGCSFRLLSTNASEPPTSLRVRKAVCKRELIALLAGAMPAWSSAGSLRLGY